MKILVDYHEDFDNFSIVPIGTDFNIFCNGASHYCISKINPNEPIDSENSHLQVGTVSIAHPYLNLDISSEEMEKKL